MQALILAISLVLFSTIKNNDTPTEITTSKAIDTLVQLREVKSYVCVQTLKDSDF